MSAISPLKESFALAASVEEREKVVAELTVAGSNDWFYYEGLVLLQRIQDAIESDDSRSTEELIKKMRELLGQYATKSDPERYGSLEARFHLLTYPINTDESIEYIHEQLGLLKGSRQQQVNSSSPEPSSLPPTHQYYHPTRLDPSMVDPVNVLKQCCSQRDYCTLEPKLAYYYYEGVGGDGSLSGQQERALLECLLRYPSPGDKVVRRLAAYYLKVGSSSLENELLSGMDQLTLEQLDLLRELVPGVANVPLYVRCYVDKLAPVQQRFDEEDWDDEEHVLSDYVDRLWTFVKTLSKRFDRLKWIVLHYRLRVQCVRKCFEDTGVFQEYLGLHGKGQEEVHVPYLQAPTPSLHKQVIEAFLAGALIQGSFPKKPLVGHPEYDVDIQQAHAKMMLMHVLEPEKTDDATPWINVIGRQAFEQLMEKTELRFDVATLHVKRARFPEEQSIKLGLQLKNIPHLSIRVFQVDMVQYWCLNPKATRMDKAAKSMNLDGLTPTWENSHVSHTSRSPLQMVNREFVFDSREFQGRGAWVIDFVGGCESCRALIQKGHLRHIVRDTSAGHLFRIFDEHDEPMRNTCRIWYNNEYFLPNASGDILLPYAPEGQAGEIRILLVADDGFCEPVMFYRKQEEYRLKANFYVNPESLVPNKQTKVIVTPQLSIHGQPVSLNLLKSVRFSVESVNARDIKSVFAKNDLTLVKNGSNELQFTVPASVKRLTFILSGKVASTSTKQPRFSVQDTEQFVFDNQSSEDPIANAHLRATPEGYCVLILGKNGEPQKGKVAQFQLKHTLFIEPIRVDLQSDEAGVIHLGPLEHISAITVTSPAYKTWSLLQADVETSLPFVIQQEAEQPFVLAYTGGVDRFCSLFQIGHSGMVIKDYTSHVSQTPNCVQVAGLPEGRYIFQLTGVDHTVTCVVNKAKKTSQQEEEGPYWLGLIRGQHLYTQMTGAPTSRPLTIKHLEITDTQVAIQLAHWSPSNTKVYVTTSAFMPPGSSSMHSWVESRKLTSPHEWLMTLSAPCTFLEGRKLSEEFEYILNRAGADKWVGSTLSKPSLLIYPEKHRSTRTNERKLQNEQGFRKKLAKKSMGHQPEVYANYLCGRPPNTVAGWNDIAFLDHDCPLLCLTPDEQGQVMIGRSALGDNSSILQVLVVGHENQAVAKTMLLPGASSTTNLKLKDLRQSTENDPTKAYMQIKSIVCLEKDRVLTLDAGQHEWETVGSFQKLFDMMALLVHTTKVEETLEKFSFLKEWPTYSPTMKLEKHHGMACHELNLWIMQKDPAFFEEHILPFVKCKLSKTFMDYYLINDEPKLREYADNLYLYRQLSPGEKALLAKRLPDMRLLVRKAFLDEYKAAAENVLDVSFDTILAGSSMKAEQPPPPPPPAAGPSTVAFGSAQARAAPEVVPVQRFQMTDTHRKMDTATQARLTALAYAQQQAAAVGMSANNFGGPVEDVEEGEREQAEEDLREALKQRQVKVPYEFIKPTSEWAEKTYYDTGDDKGRTTINQFWIDYLDTESPFLTGNFIYATSSFTEVMFALALLDVPLQSDVDSGLETIAADGKIALAAKSPCLVFYRALKQVVEDPPANPYILIGQGFFAKEDQAEDEYNMVDPGDLRSGTEYGWHLAISNVSPKSCTVEVTLQMPTGSIPTGPSPFYCDMRVIKIEPYSTWRQVVGSFYFPKAGDEYIHYPVTVSRASTLLAQTQPLSLRVLDPSSITSTGATTTTSSSSWTTLASHGSDDEVISFLEQAPLTKTPLNLITWRMVRADFAQRVLSTLRKRRFYTIELWQYGLHHQLTDAVRELLENETTLLKRCGIVFESPLVTTRPLDLGALKILDYYPLVKARAHALGSKHEILNKQFYEQYNTFLEYLTQKPVPSGEDLLMLTIYLVLQDRIGEAHAAYKRLSWSSSKVTAKTQMDYLGAYLQTRLRVEDIDARTLDLSSLRALAEKYQNHSVKEWRDRFGELQDLVDQVEQGRRILPSSLTSHDPVLDFDVAEEEEDGVGTVVLRYANVSQVQIRYYKVNAEVMFSTSPFMHRFNGKDDTGWVKPFMVTEHTLPASSLDNEEEDFEMIGVGSLRTQTARIKMPVELAHANVMVQVIGGELRRRKAHFAHELMVHFVESQGVVRVANKKTKRPVAGAYVKVYAKFTPSRGDGVKFWKDGYTGLNGVFDYVSVTEGALVKTGKETLEQIEKFSLLIASSSYGSVVEEVFPPVC